MCAYETAEETKRRMDRRAARTEAPNINHPSPSLLPTGDTGETLTDADIALMCSGRK